MRLVYVKNYGMLIMEELFAKNAIKKLIVMELICGENINMIKALLNVIYYWENADKMNAYVKTKYGIYGLSFYLPKNPVRKRINKKQLLARVKDTLDVIVHHGLEVLDRDGNVNMKKVNNAEARRFWMDKDWKKKVDTVRKFIEIKEINESEAKLLGIIDK